MINPSTASAATTIAVIRVENKPEVEIRSRDLVRVLLVDDNPDFTDPLKKQFERWGYSVDVATNPIEGNDYLAHSTYQIIIADIKFPEPFISGDEFLLQNREAILRAKTIAITGNLENITRRAELEHLNVVILDKGDPLPRLKDMAVETLDRRKNTVAHELNRAIIEIVRDREPEPKASTMNREAYDRLQRTLIRWFEKMGEPEKKSIHYKGGWYSPNDLIQEVEMGTDVGQAHMNMLIGLFEDTFSGDEENA